MQLDWVLQTRRIKIILSVVVCPFGDLKGLGFQQWSRALFSLASSRFGKESGSRSCDRGISTAASPPKCWPGRISAPRLIQKMWTSESDFPLVWVQRGFPSPGCLSLMAQFGVCSMPPMIRSRRNHPAHKFRETKSLVTASSFRKKFDHDSTVEQKMNFFKPLCASP